MGAKTGISWTQSTWTPIRACFTDAAGEVKIGWHCTHASDGCRFCYAEKLNLRLGTGQPFKPDQLSPRGNVEVFLDEKMLLQPLRWKKPRQIFPCSMTDIAADFVKSEWFEQMFGVMEAGNQHTYQVLTKRPANLRNLIGALGIKPQKHIWLGFSAEDQPNFDARWDEMRHLAEAGWLVWCSAEPLLGPLDVSAALWNFQPCSDCPNPSQESFDPNCCHDPSLKKGLSWLVAGGESGASARAAERVWFEDLIDQCRTAKVPIWFKQTGSNQIGYGRVFTGKGDDPAQWPESLRVQEMPA